MLDTVAAMRDSFLSADDENVLWAQAESKRVRRLRRSGKTQYWYTPANNEGGWCYKGPSQFQSGV
jgi:hypothetical protein